MNNSILGTSAYIQPSFLKKSLHKKRRQKSSPLQQVHCGKTANPLYFAIIYGSIIGSLLFMLLNA